MVALSCTRCTFSINLSSFTINLTLKEFLFYYEKYSPPPDLNNPGYFHLIFPTANCLKSYHSGKSMEVKPPRDWDPLVKQTYSVWVETEKGRRKWHLSKRP